MSHAQRYQSLAALTGNRPLDCSYHAAFYLLSYDPEIYETARKCVTMRGIEFAKVKRLTKGFDETSRQLIDIAHNLFSWTSKCKVTPFDISRLGYPCMELACTACYVAAGQMEVVMEPETDSLKLDDEEYRKTQQLHEKMANLYANMEIAGADENSLEYAEGR